MNPESAVEALLRVIDLLERLGVRYCVGGSYASSLFGEPRATRDVDLVVDLAPPQANRLEVEDLLERACSQAESRVL